jgi:hypothetical protein
MNKIVIVVSMVLFSFNALSWGMLGHRITGEIASKHLSAKAQSEIKSIIGEDSLAQLSNYPDFVKSDPVMRKKYSAWHYVSYSKKETILKRKVSMKGDILYGISYFTKILKEKESSKRERREALAFIIHFIGDVHQPLHVGFPHDKGGNNVKVKWFGEDTNLHAVWDEKLIKLQEMSYTEYAVELNKFSENDKRITSWQLAKVTDWAKESRDYLPKTYEFKQGKYWEFSYNYKHLDFLNQRLLKGGVRLAGHLNTIFSM